MPANSARWAYTKGLHDLGGGLWAYLQPDGGWGWSNAGLIVDGDRSLLVDTLYDMRLTREMLGRMADATGRRAEDIGTIVNTHANGDHCNGNACCANAEIIASAASAAEMESFTPAQMARLVEAGPTLGPGGRFIAEIFGPFDFAGVEERLPTRTFSGELALRVGDKEVRLIEVGPAHTKGDVLVHAPDDRTVFTGDILFIDGTPIMWEGPVRNWLAACDRILAMDVDAIVPGHGPITDKAGVRRVRDYLEYCDREARKRFDAGMSVREAAHDIALGDFDSRGDAERIAVNVDTLYREYAPDAPARNMMAVWELMAELRH